MMTRDYMRLMLDRDQKKEKQQVTYRKILSSIQKMIDNNKPDMREMNYGPEYSEGAVREAIRRACMESMFIRFGCKRPYPMNLTQVLKPFKIRSVKGSGKIHYFVEYNPELILTQEYFDTIKY